MPIEPVTLPIGVVLSKLPGTTRWAPHLWKATSVLPGAAPANWKLLRSIGGVSEYHVTTLPLELWPSETEAYLNGLSARVPSVCVVLRPDDHEAEGIVVALVTASPYEAQDYMDSGEEIVELVPMPEGLVAFVRDFCRQHHRDEAFVKRRRDRVRVDQRQDGIGDARIRQASDVYRAPRRRTPT